LLPLDPARRDRWREHLAKNGLSLDMDAQTRVDMTQLVRDGVPMELRPLVWQEAPYATSILDLVAPGWREPAPFLV
jgi:hypothetical protein